MHVIRLLPCTFRVLNVISLLFEFIFANQGLVVRAVAADVAHEEPLLSGSDLKSEDVVLRCDAVFIGQILAIGDAETASIGVDTRGASVKVLKILRGSLGTQIGVVINSARGGGVGEAVPSVGGSYIFFIRKAPTRHIVLKLLPATDAEIAKVEALIVHA